VRRRAETGSVASKLLWTLVVVAVLLLVADRVADFAAERTAADKLQSSQRLDSQPDVSIGGFPFLTQFANGRYQDVSASAHDVQVGSSGNGLMLSTVHVDFRTVTTSRDFSRFHARSATARATVSYADLGRRLGGTVRYAGDGRIEASRKFTVLGQTVRPTISVQPRAANDALSFAGARINGLADVPPEVTSALQGIFDTELSLKGIPFDITVTSLRADQKGLELTLSGRNLSYTRP
jgi:hypothetical protein